MEETTIDKDLEGWTFVIDKIETSSAGGKVRGWFMHFRLRKEKDPEGADTEFLDTHYLTPYRHPTVLDIPRFLFDANDGTDRVIDLEIGPKEIYAGLLNLFSKGYDKIPSPKVEIPMHSIPPSKRQEIMDIPIGM